MYHLQKRRCSRCRVTKPLVEFVRNKAVRSGYGPYCKPCHNIVSKRNRERRHGSSRNYLLGYRYHLLTKYGIDVHEVDELIRDQRGVCAICRERDAEQVDHDHKKGYVRGVLCGGCDAGLGQLKEDPRIIRRAIDYLMRHRPDGVQEPSVPYILSVA